MPTKMDQQTTINAKSINAELSIHNPALLGMQTKGQASTQCAHRYPRVAHICPSRGAILTVGRRSEKRDGVETPFWGLYEDKHHILAVQLYLCDDDDDAAYQHCVGTRG